MQKLPLNAEHYEDLGFVIQSDGLPIFMSLIEQLAQDLDKRVLEYDLSRGPEGLVIQKARSEGARILLTELTRLIAKLKKGEQDLPTKVK